MVVSLDAITRIYFDPMGRELLVLGTLSRVVKIYRLPPLGEQSHTVHT
jgi:hypothetical protein